MALVRRTRYPVPKADAGDLLLFPIMAALSKFPMNMTEIARALQIQERTVSKRIHELARYGYIIQRRDKRWVMVVRLRIEKPMEPVGLIGHDPVLGVRSGGLNEDVAQDVLPTATVAPGSNHRKTVVVEQQKVLNPAERLGRYFRVPSEIPDIGVLSIGTHDRCRKCLVITQLRYGGSVMCAKCARKALEKANGDAVKDETQRSA